MSITKGQTFGVAEQVTNTKLHNLVDAATISLEHDEVADNVLSSLASTAGQLRIHNLIQASMASGADIRFDGADGFYVA